jgi:hypothetical protein
VLLPAWITTPRTGRRSAVDGGDDRHLHARAFGGAGLAAKNISVNLDPPTTQQYSGRKGHNIMKGLKELALFLEVFEGSQSVVCIGLWKFRRIPFEWAHIFHALPAPSFSIAPLCFMT